MKIISRVACFAAGLMMLASCWAGGSSENSEETLSLFSNDFSSITIRCSPSTEAIVTDPEGRRTGLDVGSGKSYREIPNSSYMSRQHAGPSGAKGPDVKYLRIGTPLNGDYRLTYSAVHDTVWHPRPWRSADMTCYCPENPKQFWGISFYGVQMVAGDVHNFVIHLDKTPTGKCFATGGFEGGGEPDEIDQLLSYVNITKSRTELPPGTDSTDLFIIYGDAVLAESFKAAMNERDISSLFTPVAGGHEVVSLPVAPGKNVLTLSVRGNVFEGVATDSDKLEFTVE